MRFFTVGHGPDNYEEWVNLDRIVFIRCAAKYNPELKYYSNYEELKKELVDTIASADFDYIATITFDTGIQEKINLSALGWHELATALKERGKK